MHLSGLKMRSLFSVLSDRSKLLLGCEQVKNGSTVFASLQGLPDGSSQSHLIAQPFTYSNLDPLNECLLNKWVDNLVWEAVNIMGNCQVI